MYSLRRLSFSLNKSIRNYVKRSLTSESMAEVAVENTEKEKSIIVNKSDKITLIAINRPEKKNALDSATAQLLCDALDEFDKDENAVVGVLHGIGGNFCSGFDLHEIANYNQEKEDNLPQYGTLANKSELTSKPLVACLNGYALGAGLELALMCDLRVIEENAIIGFLNRRFGIPILCGGTVRLPAMIGYARAMDLILTGKAINGEEAFNIGLATKCTAHGTGLGTAINYAKSLIKFPQKTLLADRTSMHFATFSSKQIDEALQFEKDNALHLVTEEGIQGAKKFVEEGKGRHGKFYNLTNEDKSFKELDKSLV
ncbi:short-chain-enoyl-CoA hydratase-like [Vespa mandarinia]|uniref:short-chain-enoyl-CoA hydratase-like n=1 Tax=Vespa mandarinia TaxID=7446 RepID=UPI00161C8183|nr:short-chain-enoyl-CoA hydratase-like [Vespa mandarinia]